jgi:hypothetical protein
MPSKEIEKRREAWRKWYSNHKEKAREARQKTQERTLEWFKNYKNEQVCIRCGFTDPRVLQFHHKDPLTKFKNVSDLAARGTMKQLKEEISKCEVYCANCHFIIEDELKNN